MAGLICGGHRTRSDLHLDTDYVLLLAYCIVFLIYIAPPFTSAPSPKPKSRNFFRRERDVGRDPEGINEERIKGNSIGRALYYPIVENDLVWAIVVL